MQRGNMIEERNALQVKDGVPMEESILSKDKFFLEDPSNHSQDWNLRKKLKED
jgi:hypothetical protein